MRVSDACQRVSVLVDSAVLVLPAVAADDAKRSRARTLKSKPSATLDVASEQMRLIFGDTAGKGVLHSKGKDYPFTELIKQ